MNTNIQGDFQISISVLLNDITDNKRFWRIALYENESILTN